MAKEESESLHSPIKLFNGSDSLQYNKAKPGNPHGIKVFEDLAAHHLLFSQQYDGRFPANERQVFH